MRNGNDRPAPGWFSGQVGEVRVQAGIVQWRQDGPVPVEVLSAGDEALLLVEVQAGRPCSVVVELWRGERRRHNWTSPVQGQALLAFRLSWSLDSHASARLRCRILVDGQEAASQTVLLGLPPADAQGRLPIAPPRASAQTLLAYAEALQRQLEKGENPEGSPR